MPLTTLIEDSFPYLHSFAVDLIAGARALDEHDDPAPVPGDRERAARLVASAVAAARAVWMPDDDRATLFFAVRTAFLAALVVN